MSAVSPPIVNFGWKAPDFRLPDTHGKVWTRDSLRGPKGLVLVFMCNHCPYVRSVIDKMVKDFRTLHDMGYVSPTWYASDVLESRLPSHVLQIS